MLTKIISSLYDLQTTPKAEPEEENREVKNRQKCFRKQNANRKKK